MKSVCILVQNQYEPDIRVRRKAEALVAAGYTVDVLALRSAYSKSKTYTLGGVNVHTVSLGKKRGSLARYAFEYGAFFVWAFFKLLFLMGRRRYAVVDVNNLPDFLVFAAAYAKWKGAKVVFDMHEITPEFYISKYGIAESSWVTRFLKWIERASFNFADQVITINEPITKLLRSRGLPASKATEIMNSVDGTLFAGALAEPATGDSAKKPEKFVMMYHGTLTRIYGLDIAIEAFGSVQQQMPNAEFWILGGGPEKASLEALSRKLGLGGKVQFIGSVLPREVHQWLSRCDIGVLATRRDIFLDYSFSNKLSEYIIMGKGVISSRLKAIQHYFSGDALAYFEPGNPTDLARQMVLLYSDHQLRSRLAEEARREYDPIRWEVMKQRYLSLMGALVGVEAGVGPVSVTAASRETVSWPPCRRNSFAEMATERMSQPAIIPAQATRTALALLNYCRASDWAGYDPYDALNSRLLAFLPILNFRVPRIALTQILKRSPINLRGLLLVPRTQNPKAMALFLEAFIKLSRAGLLDDPGLVGMMVEKLADLSSADSPYWCWGYSFPWQTRTLIVPRAAPSLVCTTFVGNALLNAYEHSREERCLRMAVSAADYILKELYWTEGDSTACFSYPTPFSRVHVHNANFLGAAFLARVCQLTGEKRFLEPALKAARYSASKQQKDGSWAYGELPTQGWIDNFHTGYNLCALRALGQSLDTEEFEPNVQRGYKFYVEHFFREDGAPGYFHNRPYPVDSHCVAQSIITLLTLRDLSEEGVELAERVFGWAMARMWDKQGFFYYRVYPGWRIKTSYMRWVQAWMLLAVSTLMGESRPSADNTPVGGRREASGA